jgi:tetratricopeptide (TPR) repeat protein
VAVGNCDAYAGIGDPYLPFREIMAMLTGDVDAPFAAGTITFEHARGLWGGLLATCQALLDYGQNLIDVLVPRQALFHRVQTAVPQGIYELAHLRRLAELPQPTTELTQEHIFQQVVNVLQNLSSRHPVLLLLDDLQWADETSLSLLVHLGRRLAGHRVLIVGAYRPEEVALGRGGTRHPLEKVLTEFKRSFGQDWIDLSQTSKGEAQHFVDSFLDIEPNQFSQEFRQTLCGHTEGHPLFTVELLRHMQERGDLVKNKQGYWLAGPQLNWQDLPVRVEAVIEERIGRIQEELRQVLTVASINGEEFMAQVVAQVQDTDERHLLRKLSQVLAKQHRLVKERDEISVGDQILSRYRFVHVLFQRYLYNELSPGERRLLHGDTGVILEMLYSDQVGEIAVQLAWHFQEGNIPEKARQYLQLAGEQAARQYANDEAVIYLSRALEMWPESAYNERYKLLMVREKVYDLQGARESQDEDLTSLQSLAGTRDDDQKRAAVVLRRANFAEATSDYPAAIKAAREAIELAEVVESTTVEIRGYLRWGWTLSMQGQFEEAKPLVERALLLAKGTPQESRALANLGIFLAQQDDLNRAKSYFEQALLISRQSGNQQIEGSMLNNLGIVAGMQGDYTQAKTYFERALLLKRKIGDRRGEAMVLDNFGDAFKFLGDYTQAKLYLEQALFITREINNRKEGGNILYNLGNISHCQGDCIKARAYYEQALHLRREIGDCEGQAEVLAYLSLLFHHLGEDKTALEYSQQAMQIAQDVGSQHVLGYALTHQGHGLAGLGQLAEASEAYHKALTIRRKAGADNRATEPLAGLAQVSLIQGNLQQAKDQVEEILNHLETGTLDGTEEPFRIYLTCYRVLQADQDPRAETILAISYQQLQERAAKITDDETRVSFLKNVAAHREIVTEFEK